MPNVVEVIRRPRNYPGHADNEGQTEYYLVRFDDQGWSFWEARNASGVPVDGEPLSDGSALRVTYKNAVEMQDTPLCAIVEVRWSVPTLGTFEPMPEGGGKSGGTPSRPEGDSRSDANKVR